MNEKFKAWYRHAVQRWIPVIIFLVSLSEFYLGYINPYLSRCRAARRAADEKTAKDMRPGQYRQIKTLDDGSRETLDSNAAALPLTIPLSDGTSVKLCHGSSLRYGDFNGETREATLNGQAEFGVAKNIDKPFIVHTRRTTTWVLGTRFNVMDYAEEPEGEVTLLEGRLEVIHGSQTKLLKPSQQAVAMKDRLVVRGLLHPEGSIGWEAPNPYLEFENTDLTIALLRLARYYQVKIVNPEKVSGRLVSGQFSLRMTLDYNLNQIRVAEHKQACLERRGDKIFVTAPKNH